MFVCLFLFFFSTSIAFSSNNEASSCKHKDDLYVFGFIFLMWLLSKGTDGNDSNDSNSKDEGATKYGICPYSNRFSCEGCPEINPYDQKHIDFYTVLQKCNARYCYVDPDKSPSENILGY